MEGYNPVRPKRIYEEPGEEDGYRVLVDRLWPRGVSKDEACLDEWQKEIAPSDELRKWFDHEPDKFEEFRSRYEQELSEKSDLVEHLVDKSRTTPVTLLYAARDREHNQAVVLADLIRSKRQERG